MHTSSCNPQNHVQSTIENWEEIKYKNYNNVSTNKNGGMHQKWDKKLKNGSHLVEQPETFVWDGMANVKSSKVLEVEKAFNNPYGGNPFAVNYKDCTGIDDLCDKIKRYAENFTTLEPSTIDRDIRYIRHMADINQPFPIDFFKPSYSQYIYHMTWYKDNYYNPESGKNFYGIKQKRESFNLYLKACGIPVHYFPYDLPSHPKEKPIEFPNPDIAYEITRYPFYKDKEKNWLYQFIHLYNFIVGPRPPSETCKATINGIDWDDCSIIFPQQKKHNSLRKVFVYEVFVNGRTRKSLRNYVDHHRPKFVTQFSDDYLFISPNTGRPFTPAFLGKKLNETGKLLYPKWYPYMARHFCATGKLIQAYLLKDPDPIKVTQDYMDHDKRQNTEKYTRLARDYFRKYKYDWFKRILKNKNHYRFSWGKYAEKSKQSPKTSVSSGNSPRAEDSPDQIRTGD